MKAEAMEVRDASPGYAPQVAMPVVPEGYKQTEVGVIPEDWVIVALSSLIETGSRITYGVVQPGKNDPNGVLLIRGGDVYGGKILQDQLRRISKAISNEYKRTQISGGELLISLVGYPGEAALAPASLAGANIARQVALVKLDPAAELSSEYICAFLRSNLGRKQLLKEALGSAQQVINLKDVSKVSVILPTSITEQHAIATALSDVDALLEALDRLIAKKRDIKQATMQQLLTAQTRLPGFEGEWKRLLLGEIVTFLSGGTPSRQNQSYWKGDIPWISAMTLRTFYVWRSDSNVTKEGVAGGSKMAPVGSVLLLVRGSALHNEILAGLVTKPVCFNQDVKALLPQAGLCGKFLTFLLHGRAEDLLKLVSSAGNTAGVMDTKLLKAFELRLPPLDEQFAIATLLSDIDAEIGVLQQRRAKTAALKQAMMQELLTGRTRIAESKKEIESC